MQLGLGSLGGAASLGGSLPASAAGGEVLSTAQALERLSLVMARLDMHVGQLSNSGVGTIFSLPAEHEMHSLLRQVGAIVSCCVPRDESALALAQKVFKRMFEQASGGAGRLHTQINVQLLMRIDAVCKKVARFVTDVLVYSEDERKLNEDIVASLIHAQARPSSLHHRLVTAPPPSHRVMDAR